MSVIPDDHLDLLQSRALAFMATIGPKGEPQVSAVWFTWDGMSLRFALNKKRQKYRNLTREPRVAVAIADPSDPYRALEIRGIGHIESDLGFRCINAASQKYVGRDATPEEAGPIEDRMVIVVEPERVIPFLAQEDKK